MEKFKNVEMTYLFYQRILIENRKNESVEKGCRGGMGMEEGGMDGRGFGHIWGPVNDVLSMMSVPALYTYKKEKQEKKIKFQAHK